MLNFEKYQSTNITMTLYHNKNKNNILLLTWSWTSFKIEHITDFMTSIQINVNKLLLFINIRQSYLLIERKYLNFKTTVYILELN